MADTYSSIVTNVGESEVLKNTINGYSFKVSRIEIGSRANLDLVDAMTWKNMSAANVVYTISSEKQINEAVRRVQLDENTVQFRITLGTEVGGTMSNGLIFGSIGLYLRGYDENGNESKNQILFAVGSLGSEFIKYAQGSGVSGNLVSFYLNVRISNAASIDHILVAPTETYSLPTVSTEKASNLNDYYNAYVVNDYDESGLSSVAFKTNRNSENFEFLLNKNDLSSRLSMGGIYAAPKQDSEEHRYAYYTGDKDNGYVFHLLSGVVLCFPNGFYSDGSFKNERVEVVKNLESSNFIQSGAYFCLISREEGNLFFEIIEENKLKKSREEVRLEDQSGTYSIWYDLKNALVFKVTSSSRQKYDCTVVAKFKIKENGEMEYFYPATAFSYVDSLSYNSLTTFSSDLEQDSLKRDESCVHKKGEETVLGVKTFSGGGEKRNDPSINVSNINPNIRFNSTSSSGYSASIDCTSQGKLVNTFLMEEGRVGIATWSSSAVTNNKNTDLQNSEYLLINSNFDSNTKVVQTSKNVQESFVQDVLATYSKNVTLAGTYNFVNEITAPRANTLATSALFADLGEFYKVEEEMPIGTLITFGGKEEIFACVSSDVNGVISENPGFVLNSKCKEHGQPVALSGRVKVRVLGEVNKGDFIYSSFALGINKKGVAVASQSKLANETAIGKALESNDSVEEKLVECVVRISF